jgi:hypothetical protein
MRELATAHLLHTRHGASPERGGQGSLALSGVGIGSVGFDLHGFEPFGVGDD